MILNYHNLNNYTLSVTNNDGNISKVLIDRFNIPKNNKWK